MKNIPNLGIGIGLRVEHYNEILEKKSVLYVDGKTIICLTDSIDTFLETLHNADEKITFTLKMLLWIHCVLKLKELKTNKVKLK